MSTYRQGTTTLDRLRPDPTNVRADLGDLTELTASIKTTGILQPLLVRPHTDGHHLVILDGHRRYAAAAQAGTTEVPVLVASTRAAATPMATMLAAALHKRLEPIEQARAFKALRDQGMATTDIARATGYSVGTIRDRLLLLDLPAQAQAMVTDGTLGLAAAAGIARQVKARGVGSGRVRSGHLPAYFTGTHPLADTVRGICTHDGDRHMVGQIGCGPCWEAAIRADATGHALAPVIDESAVQRALTGDTCRLTIAELDETVARLTASGMSAAKVADHLGITPRSVERSKTRQRRQQKRAAA